MDGDDVPVDQHRPGVSRDVDHVDLPDSVIPLQKFIGDRDDYTFETASTISTAEAATGTASGSRVRSQIEFSVFGSYRGQTGTSVVRVTHL